VVMAGAKAGRLGARVHGRMCARTAVCARARTRARARNQEAQARARARGGVRARAHRRSMRATTLSSPRSAALIAGRPRRSSDPWPPPARTNPRRAFPGGGARVCSRDERLGVEP
jgi:hypothetical protein